ncbi:hypothetical protein H5410_004873 [Solanum commersonii]|uniref:Uncharacterized protein n=1 Tax=Solanum commersonii TaxID=4109 RepID=A0A9J6A6H0_SOLCO|nr:hypothetical protein H5410_004873 [Solanum commersonii]
MNTNEFTHVNETSFSRSGPIEINSDTPIIPKEVYERHYGNYQENEKVEIDEEDLDDTPTSPDFNSTEVPPQEDNPSVGTSRPLIVPTRARCVIPFIPSRSIPVRSGSIPVYSGKGRNRVSVPVIPVQFIPVLVNKPVNPSRSGPVPVHSGPVISFRSGAQS